MGLEKGFPLNHKMYHLNGMENKTENVYRILTHVTQDINELNFTMFIKLSTLLFTNLLTNGITKLVF